MPSNRKKLNPNADIYDILFMVV